MVPIRYRCFSWRKIAHNLILIKNLKANPPINEFNPLNSTTTYNIMRVIMWNAAAKHTVRKDKRFDKIYKLLLKKSISSAD